MNNIYISTYFLTNQAGFGAVIEEEGRYIQVYGHLNSIKNRCEANLMALKEVLTHLPQIANYCTIYLECSQTLSILKQGLKNQDPSRAQCLRQISYHQKEKKLRFELQPKTPLKQNLLALSQRGYHDYEFFHIVGSSDF